MSYLVIHMITLVWFTIQMTVLDIISLQRTYFIIKECMPPHHLKVLFRINQPSQHLKVLFRINQPSQHLKVLFRIHQPSQHLMVLIRINQPSQHLKVLFRINQPSQHLKVLFRINQSCVPLLCFSLQRTYGWHFAVYLIGWNYIKIEDDWQPGSLYWLSTTLFRRVTTWPNKTFY